MANQLSPEQISDPKEIFSRFDKDHDEKLTISELRTAIGTLWGRDPTEAELQDLIKEVHADGKETIELPEFLNMIGRKASHNVSEEEMRESAGACDEDKSQSLSAEQISDPKEIFSRLDEGHDGKLTISELRTAIGTLWGRDPTEAELRDLIKGANADGKDTIELREFLTMIGFSTSHDVSEEEMEVCDEDSDGYTTEAESRCLSAGQISDPKEIFSRFDQDQDEKLTISELHTAIGTLWGRDPTEAELRDLIKGANADGKDTIEFPEFLTMIGCNTSHGISEEEMEVYDEDSDGYSTETESQCLSAGQISDLKETFDLFDQDRDGRLTISELHTVIRTLQGRDLTEAELQDLVMLVDADGNGTIEFPEFLTLMGRRTSNDVSEKEIMKSFRMYDKDGDGYITGAELRQVMAELGNELTEDDVKDMISVSDLDGDGRIDFGEFVKMMQRT